MGVGADENFVYPMCKLNTFSRESSSEKKSKILQLRFKYSYSNRMPDVVYTGIPIRGREGSSIEVVLIDVLTEKVVKTGSEASAKVEILVLKNAFDKNDNTDTWTAKEFEACIVEGRHGKASLLARTSINLTEGSGSLNDIFFSHTKRPLRKIEVRLGARIIQGMGSCHGAARIREAVSSPFTVKDKRAIRNKNDYKLSRTNKVWRLKNIGKDGPSHKNLFKEGIEEVGHLLNMHMEDHEKLKNILAKTMSPEMLTTTINHAKTCEHEHIPLGANHHDEKLKHILGPDMSAKLREVTFNHARRCVLDNKLYVYYPSGSQQKKGVVFTINVGQVMAVFSDCQYIFSEKLSEAEKAEAGDMVISAFKNWHEVITFDDEASITDFSSGLSTAYESSNTAILSNSDSSKLLTPHMNERCDYPKPSNSSLDIIPSMYSLSAMTGLDDCSLQSMDSINVTSDQPLDIPGQVANNTMCDTESITQASLLQQFPGPVIASHLSNCTWSENTIDVEDYVVDDFVLNSMDSINVTSDKPLDIPVQVSNNTMCDTESIITPAFCDNGLMHSFDSNHPLQISTLGSPNDGSGGVDYSLEIPVPLDNFQTAANFSLRNPVPLEKAQTRWKMLFSVLIWSSLRRIVVGKYKQ